MSPVALQISSPLLLEHLLRLPAGTTLLAAGTGQDMLTLIVDIPGAPAGAATVDLTYTRQTGLPDPVTLTGLRWLAADGTEIPAAEAPQDASQAHPEHGPDAPAGAGQPHPDVT